LGSDKAVVLVFVALLLIFFVFSERVKDLIEPYFPCLCNQGKKKKKKKGKTKTREGECIIILVSPLGL
jgi:hypothetical protein